jgi:hypothetical protein
MKPMVMRVLSCRWQDAAASPGGQYGRADAADVFFTFLDNLLRTISRSAGPVQADARQAK